MAGRFSADVVFCLDSSGSMKPCFEALRDNIQSFVGALDGDSQGSWDLRLDFLSHRAGEHGQTGIHDFSTVHLDDPNKVVKSLYGQREDSKSFFTSEVDSFRRSLMNLKAYGDEANFVALDTCLDFPWRESSACHRVVILLTDEPLETGVCVEEQKELIGALIEKLHALSVKLFLVGPESWAYDELCAADRSEYVVVDDGGQSGLTTVDFGKVLEVMAKSISVSILQTPHGADSSKRGLFGQSSWTEVRGTLREK